MCVLTSPFEVFRLVVEAGAQLLLVAVVQAGVALDDGVVAHLKEGRDERMHLAVQHLGVEVVLLLEVAALHLQRELLLDGRRVLGRVRRLLRVLALDHVDDVEVA